MRDRARGGGGAGGLDGNAVFNSRDYPIRFNSRFVISQVMTSTLRRNEDVKSHWRCTMEPSIRAVTSTNQSVNKLHTESPQLYTFPQGRGNSPGLSERWLQLSRGSLKTQKQAALYTL